jgi:hypothetical protein
MTALVLAGLLGVILAGGDAAAESGQSAASPRPTPASPASQVGLPLSATDALAAAPADEESGARRTPREGDDRVWRFGRRRAVLKDSSDEADSGCRAYLSPAGPTIDPGILIKPPNSGVHYTLRIIVPKGCIDPGIFAPRGRR